MYTVVQKNYRLHLIKDRSDCMVNFDSISGRACNGGDVIFKFVTRNLDLRQDFLKTREHCHTLLQEEDVARECIAK